MKQKVKEKLYIFLGYNMCQPILEKIKIILSILSKKPSM